MTDPQPSKPAATAPCSASGAAASGHARRLDARHQPVFGNRHQRRIENPALRIVGQRPADQQPDVVRE